MDALAANESHGWRMQLTGPYILIVTAALLLPHEPVAAGAPESNPSAVSETPVSEPGAADSPPATPLTSTTAPRADAIDIAKPTARAAPVALPPQETLPLGRGPDESAATVEAGPAAGSGILRTLTALGVVIGLVLVTRVLIQKLGGRGWTGPSRANLVEVLARAPIGGKNEVLFLKIRQQVLVIGQCPSGLSTLWCMQEPEDVAWLLGQVEASRPRSISDGFRQLLKTAETDYGADAESEPAVDASEAATEGARAEISGLMARLDLLRRGQGEGSR